MSKCAKCKQQIVGARTVINGLWYCPTCTYKHDYPDREVPDRLQIRGPKIQTETLFPLPLKEKR